MMKNLMFCLALLFAAVGVMAQSSTKTPAQEATDKLTQLYGLSPEQQVEMLKVQERKFRNLAEIEGLKTTDYKMYMRKIQSIQYGNNASLQRLLNPTQDLLWQQQQTQLRERKLVAQKEMKAAGASQQQIEQKMLELDIESL